MGRQRRLLRGVGLLTGVILLCVPHRAAAQPADSSDVRRCNPWIAFGAGVMVPGGGQFYLGDIAGGVQAVATDLVLFEALRRNGSTARGIAFFLGAVHVVEGLYAAQSCRGRGKKSLRPYPSSSPNSAFVDPRTFHVGRAAEEDGWRVELAFRVPLAR